MASASRYASAGRLDGPGLGLSIGATTLGVYTVIEAPVVGWTSTATVAASR